MFSSRTILGSVVIAVLVLPMAGLGIDVPLPEPKDTDEYKRSALVVDGEVKSVKYLDEKDQESSTGLLPRYRLLLEVSVIRKAKEASAEKGGLVKVLGWARKQKETYPVPKEKDLVIAFLKKTSDAKNYEPVAPKTGFRIVGGSNFGAAPAPPVKKGK